MIEPRENTINEIINSISGSFDFSQEILKKEIEKTDDFESRINILTKLAKKNIPLPSLFDCLINISKILTNRSEYKAAADVLDYAAAIETRADEYKNYLGSVYYNYGVIHFRQSQWAACEEKLKLSNHLYSEQADLVGEIKCKNVLGALMGERGNLLSAKKYFSECSDLLQEVDEEYLSAMVSENLGIIYNAQKRFDTALPYFNRALVYFQKINDIQRLSEVRYNMGLLFTYQKKYDLAFSEIDMGFELAEKIKYMPIFGMLNLSKANIYLLRKDYSAFIESLEEALNVSSKINDRMTLADAYKLQGVYSSMIEEYDNAIQSINKSIEINEELGNEYNLSECNLELGLVYWKKKDIPSARIHIGKSLEYKQKIESFADVEYLQSLLKELENRFNF